MYTSFIRGSSTTCLSFTEFFRSWEPIFTIFCDFQAGPSLPVAQILLGLVSSSLISTGSIVLVRSLDLYVFVRSCFEQDSITRLRLVSVSAVIFISAWFGILVCNSSSLSSSATIVQLASSSHRACSTIRLPRTTCIRIPAGRILSTYYLTFSQPPSFLTPSLGDLRREVCNLCHLGLQSLTHAEFATSAI